MSAVEQVAQRLIRAWREGRRQPVEGLRLDSEAQAYDVQRRVAEAMGWFADAPARAWKLGGAPGSLISAAGVPAGTVRASGWQVPPGHCHALGIEGELFVRLSRDLDEHTDLAAAYAAIDAWMPGIELCDTRWVDGIQADALLRLADQQLNRELIVGLPVTLAAVPDWSAQAATLHVDGEQVVRGLGSHPFREPLNSLPWLARHAVALGNPLRAGDLIATGSWTGIHWAPPGASIEVDFPGIGSVTLAT
ncbi:MULTISPECIES: fumarylacetoacetate hydrolase family protein [unclassified Pseudomonas]|uniref:fumarylacetoacetate hydrolase family protein n=1 Tax=unclassified Pseudomonas TaxID=196821 RepID=UPI00177B3744|nr:fumarylacetoacetate hydrolase family protein [Pseudomonas sp. CFBP 8771]MBD8622139.1 fumarylacetoacetate hydrolase family protein [Pseudomonas sp. CFBP 13727]